MTDQTLVIDIGGTNTRVAMARGAEVALDTIRRYRNAEHASLTPVIADYLAQSEASPAAVCVAGAGPIQNDVLKLTNLDWEVSVAGLKQETGAQHAALLNDLQAQGHAIDALPFEAVTPLLAGRSALGGEKTRAKLVINVGTGFNIAPIYYAHGRTIVPASEAGHALLPAQTADEQALIPFLEARHGFAAVEEALSGRGLEAIYSFVSGDGVPAAEMMARLEAGEAAARRAMALFVGILGRVAGNLALIHLPIGGVYLVGGVARHAMPFLLDYGFAEGFRDKGRFSDFMDQFPVFSVTDDYAALTGCAAHMAEILLGGAAG